jgi:hypothetical protein
MQLNFQRFLLASGLAILVLLTGCASAYRPTENALKSIEPDDGLPYYGQVYKIDEYISNPTLLNAVIARCNELKKNGNDTNETNKFCDNPSAYKIVTFAKLGAGGRAPSAIIRISNDRPVQIGSIVKIDPNGKFDSSLISSQPESEDCKWVGLNNNLVHPPAQVSSTEIRMQMAGGFLFGATMPLVALPVISYQVATRDTSGGVVCDGWDYRVAYKTWLENYQSM